MPDEQDVREIADLRERARKARVVAHQVSDNGAKAWLKTYAEGLESRADALEGKHTLPPAAAVPSGEPSITEAMAALKTETAPEQEPPGEKPEPVCTMPLVAATNTPKSIT